MIRGDRIVMPDGVRAGQVAITGGKIAAVAPAQTELPARRFLDVSGLVLLPGAVDIHTHLRDPGQTHKEDFRSGTAAAAAGGWTTVIAQPNTTPPLTTVAALKEAIALGQAKALVDFGVAALAIPGHQRDLPDLRAAGAALFEVGMADMPAEWQVTTLAELVPILEAGAATATLVAVYAADAGLNTLFTNRLQAAGRKDPAAPGEGRPGWAESAGIAAVMEAVRGTGAQVHIRQVSSAAGVEALARGRGGLGGRVTAEVNPHHLFLTDGDAPALGPWGRVIPPLRGEADQDRLWAALHSGEIDLIATDHAPHTAQEKLAGEGDIWKAASGLPVLETALPLLLDRVVAGAISLEEVARWTAERPARRVGLFPRKGVIAPGADADFMLAELGPTWTVAPERLQSKAKWTPFAGRSLRARIVQTLVRGEVVFDGGRIDESGKGQFIRP